MFTYLEDHRQFELVHDAPINVDYLLTMPMKAFVAVFHSSLQSKVFSQDLCIVSTSAYLSWISNHQQIIQSNFPVLNYPLLREFNQYPAVSLLFVNNHL